MSTRPVPARPFKLRNLPMKRLAHAVDQLQRDNAVLIGAVEELTLQVQFLLRSITDTKEVVGILDIKPRKVTMRMLDLYRRRKPALIKELNHEREALEAAKARDHQRLIDAITAAGIDPNNADGVDEFIRQVEAGDRPDPLTEPDATAVTDTHADQPVAEPQGPRPLA